MALAPAAYLLKKRAQTASIMYLQFIQKISAGEQTFRPWTSSQGYVGIRKQPSQLAQGRQRHHRVANPVGASDDDALNASYLEVVHGLIIGRFTIYHLTFLICHFGRYFR